MDTARPSLPTTSLDQAIKLCNRSFDLNVYVVFFQIMLLLYLQLQKQIIIMDSWAYDKGWPWTHLIFTRVRHALLYYALRAEHQ
jgi:hypothetical protein